MQFQWVKPDLQDNLGFYDFNNDDSTYIITKKKI